MVDTWATVGVAPRSAPTCTSPAGSASAGCSSRPTRCRCDRGRRLHRQPCMVVEGARVGQGSVLGAGTILNPSIPVIDAETGEEVSRGHVPDYCVGIGAATSRVRGGEFFLPACSSSRASRRASDTTRSRSTTSCATTGSRREPLDDALAIVRDRLGERPRGRARGLGRAARSSIARTRRRTRGRQRRRAHDAASTAAASRRRAPRHGARATPRSRP